jgi:parallel beta-helix repeat protein
VFESSARHGAVAGCWIEDAAGIGVRVFADGVIVRESHIGASSAAYLPPWGVQISAGGFASVCGNAISQCSQHGIVLLGAVHHAAVDANTVQRCGGAGIDVEGGVSDSSICANACFSNAYGIRLVGSNGGCGTLAVTGNTVGKSSAYGIQAVSVTESVISGNVARDSARDGILAKGCRGCAVVANVASRSGQAGIALEDSSDCVCDGNVASDNGSDASAGNRRAGIAVVAGSAASTQGNVVAGNRCFNRQSPGTQQFGISVLGAASNTLVEGNLVDGNAQAGRALLVSSAAAPTTHEVPYRKLSVTVAAGGTAVAHGLPYAPAATAVTMTSDGTIWKSAPASATSIFLKADRDGRTAEVLVG